MSFILAPDIPAPGFSFDNCYRNEILKQNGYPVPKFKKTGTTIAGIVYKDGVILGADTRATENTVISDKNCEKIHYITKNIYCCGAGTAADTCMTTRTVSSQLEMLRLHTGRSVPVLSAVMQFKRMLFRYRGEVSASLILGGVDSEGPHVHSIYPHGSTDKLPYATLGSGALIAMGVFESKWKQNMKEEAAKSLIREAICGGIFNDLGSGSNVDICVIRKDGSVEYTRSFDQPNIKGHRQGRYRYPRGTTAILGTREIPLEVQFESARRVVRGQPIVEFHDREVSDTQTECHGRAQSSGKEERHCFIFSASGSRLRDQRAKSYDHNQPSCSRNQGPRPKSQYMLYM